MDTLLRFRRAQDEGDAGFEVALRELQAGRKRSHWIWYVFPQLAGLGQSAMAQAFGIRDRDEAESYLRDDVLRARLARAVATVAEQLEDPRSLRLDDLMGGHIDALKLVSSLTLFEAVAIDLHAREPEEALAALAADASRGLAVADSQGYPRCAFTLRQLGHG